MCSATHKRSRRLGMLPEEINQLIANIPSHERKTTSPTEVNEVLEPPLILQLHINKPKHERLLHHMRMYTPPMGRTLHNQHEKELRNILKYIQILGLVHAYDPRDGYLLAEPAVKHYVWKTQYNFYRQ